MIKFFFAPSISYFGLIVLSFCAGALSGGMTLQNIGIVIAVLMPAFVIEVCIQRKFLQSDGKDPS